MPFAAEAERLLEKYYGIAPRDLRAAELELVPAGKPRDVGIDRALIGGYLYAPSLPFTFGKVYSAVDRVQHAFSRDTFSFFASSYTRMALYLHEQTRSNDWARKA